MSEPALAAGAAADSGGGEGAVPDQQVTQPVGNDQSGFNPAWNPVLEKLPTEFHKLIQPDLQSWDKKFEEQLQQVQSRFDPYKEFVDNQIPPEQLQTALQLMAVIDADPRGFHDQMEKFYADEWGQGPQSDNSDDMFELGGEEETQDWTQHPKAQELIRNQEAMVQFFQQQAEQQKQAEDDANLETQLAELKQQHGEFDETVVIPLAMNGMSLEDAVQKYFTLTAGTRQTASDGAPAVFRPSGAIPSTQPDPAQWTAKQTRQSVAAILQQAKEGQ